MSSILIKGADMPENCGICNAIYHGVICHVVFKSLEERPKNCPLVKVPEPHGRLIDADKLMAENERFYIPRFAISESPTVIEAEGEHEDNH